MVKLTPIEQEMFVKAQPAVFNPCTGAWGRRGCTKRAPERSQESLRCAALSEPPGVSLPLNPDASIRRESLKFHVGS